MAAVDDHRRRTLVVHAREQTGHHVERALRGREADALQMAAGLGDQAVQPLEAQGQVAPPLVAGQRVHLVDDDGVHAAQHGPGGGRGQQQVQRLGRGDQNVRRVLAHGGPLGRRRVAGAHGDPQPGVGVAQPRRLVPDFGQRDVQVLVHVDGQGPQRGDVEHLGEPALAGPGVGGPVGGVDGHQEPGQGLPGPGGRGHQDVASRRRCGARPPPGAPSARRGSGGRTRPPPPGGTDRPSEAARVGHPSISPGCCDGRAQRSRGRRRGDSERAAPPGGDHRRLGEIEPSRQPRWPGGGRSPPPWRCRAPAAGPR